MHHQVGICGLVVIILKNAALMKVIVTLTVIAQDTLDADQTTVVMDGLPGLIVALIKLF